MQRLSGGVRIADRYRGAVIALGNFDGFHRGHQAVVGRAVSRARSEGRPAIVATFDPHPIRLFRADAAPFQLTTIEQRMRLFADAGADATLVFGFDAALASVGAEAFVRDWLVEQAGASWIVTGEDFTFGKGRSGTPATMRALGERYGLSEEAVAPVADADGVISSSRIRAALQSGEPQGAARLLTRPYTIEGVVAHGDKRGRTIGYPTANIALGDYLRPRYGIYAVRARLADGSLVDGAANLGIRPSFDPPKELLETYMFDWSGDLYGRPIAIELHAFLRPEAKFDSLDALTAQMDRDCTQARAILAASSPLA